jgi:4-amino-4-deoxy-L-arabinose transferase-like glycosyltransferase
VTSLEFSGAVGVSNSPSRLPSSLQLVVLLILLISAWIQWTTARETRVNGPGRPDAASYVSYAYNLREFGVYSRERTWNASNPSPPVADAISTPGYPLFLTAFLRGKPDLSFMAHVVLAQAALGVVTTLFVFLMAIRITSPAFACAAALLTAVTPHLATINTYVLTESLFTCLLMASAWAFVRAVQSPRLLPWALAGGLFGLCCLVRPALQILLPLVCITVALVPRWRTMFRPVALATACWAVLLLPWFVYQQSIPSSPTQPNLLRASLYHGSFPGFVFDNHVENYGYPYRDDPYAPEIMASNAALVRHVGARMRAQPVRYLGWYLLGKPLYFLAWNDDVAADGDIYIYPVDSSPYQRRPTLIAIHALMLGLHWPLMLAGFLGSTVLCVRPQWLRLSPARLAGGRTLALLFLSAIVLHMIGAPFPRYGIPFWPIAYIVALAATAAVIANVRNTMATSPSARIAQTRRLEKSLDTAPIG